MDDADVADGDRALAGARERMLALLRREIGEGAVLDAFRRVPRERFVPESLRARAYDDAALPIGFGQTISQPLVVAIMTAAVAPQRDDRALDLGTGSGYQAALLAELTRDVIGVERVAELRERAAETLSSLGYGNARVLQAGDRLGRVEDAPYDVIVVAAGAPHVPRALVDQLAMRGRMVVPVGSRERQELVLARKTAHGVELSRLGCCGFVPLIGDEAWAIGGRSPGGNV